FWPPTQVRKSPPDAKTFQKTTLQSKTRGGKPTPGRPGDEGKETPLPDYRLAELLDPDRRRLELRRPRFRVGRVDGNDVRRHVVLEVKGHERQSRPESRVEPDRGLDGAAA